MPSARSCLLFSFAVALWAVFSGCGGNGASATGGGTATTTTTTPPACTTLGTGGDPTVAQCATCLGKACSAQQAACGPDCFAIQACLDAVCAHLSETGAMTEGDCQAYCQNLHMSGKAAHLAWVNCVSGAEMGCQPACAGPPYDYEQCATTQTAGCCKPAADACTASSDCSTYVACASSCTTATACEKCASDTPAGEKAYEALQACVDATCLPLYWLP